MIHCFIMGCIHNCFTFFQNSTMPSARRYRKRKDKNILKYSGEQLIRALLLFICVLREPGILSTIIMPGYAKKMAHGVVNQHFVEVSIGVKH